MLFEIAADLESEGVVEHYLGPEHDKWWKEGKQIGGACLISSMKLADPPVQRCLFGLKAVKENQGKLLTLLLLLMALVAYGAIHMQ